MTCQQFVEFLDRYCDASLPPAERERFEAHLSLCLDCRNYLATYRQTIRMSKDAFGDSNQPVPAEIPASLVKAILAARRGGTSS